MERSGRRPEQSEFAPYAQAYVSLVKGSRIVAALTRQGEATDRLLRRVDDRFASRSTYEPGKWTVKETLAHVTDCERIFAYRALCVARGERRPLPGFDQEQYARAAEANRRSLAHLLQEFRAVRAATVALFAGLPADAWSRRGEVNGYSVTTRGLAFHIAGHELHHVNILRRKYLDGRTEVGLKPQ